MALKFNEFGQLEVRIASENSRKILGYGPEQLFELPSFLDILARNTRLEMIARIHQVLTDVDGTEETRLDVFPLSLTFQFEPEIRLWCAIHRAPNPKGLVICEFEEYSESFYLKDIGVATSLPVKQPPHMGVDVTPEELSKSTTTRASHFQYSKLLGRQRTNNSQHSTFSIR